MNRYNKKIINRLVFNLRKPGRYIGCELNSIIKETPFIRMAVCYPDLYEVGMSNNGIRILYDIANKQPDVLCERVFSVEDDFEKKIRDMNMPLYTLESYTPLCDLDMIGFNLAYELLYTNVLQVLDLGHIPLYSKDRGADHPLIIAGGEAVSNPLPVSDFFDAFFLGDGEEGIIDILNTIRTSKNEHLHRIETLDLLSRIEGVYVPSKKPTGIFNEKNIEQTELNRGILPHAVKSYHSIKKRFISADSLYNPQHPIIPNLRITQERLVIEITRGCKNLCNFCHAGYYELPYRSSKPDMLSSQILSLIDNSYYTDMTLSSLSISDYKYLIPLLNSILPSLIEKGISISLPSLRVDKRTLPVIKQISDLRKTSLTFAVESACEEIRSMANKKLQTDDILSIAEHVFAGGWKLLKLYFMIGLPGCEEYDEAAAIIELLKKLYLTGGRKRELNVTISPFVPKPHTPFQWEKQMDAGYFTDTILKIKRGLPRQLAIKAHDVNASLLEGIISRGDSDLNRVIYKSYIDGARLDSWKEHFKFDIWKKNLDDLQDWKKYTAARDKNAALPWSFISNGFEKVIMKQREKISSSCRQVSQKPPFEELDAVSIAGAINSFKRKYEVKKRIRIKFAKQGMAKYISHLDFMQVIIRALRIADVPVAFTQGFNKRERIAMGFPVPVGIESECELCDVDLYDDINMDSVAAKLNNCLPEGIVAHNVITLENKKSIMSITAAALFEIEINDDILYYNFIKNSALKHDFVKESDKGKRNIKFDDAVFWCNIQNGDTALGTRKILIKIAIGNENSVRIDNIAVALAGTTYDEFYKLRITKLCQYSRDKTDGELKEI
ncbi:MAG: TIGR03960 family B12-binding radical SAM protein [Spirochaetota bacterium]